MRAMCVVEYGRPLEPMERPRPSPAPGHALVEVLACGLCFSDVKTARGKMPYSASLKLPHVPGHEISGRIAECNGESSFAPGDRVVVFHNWACHRCSSCRRGEENLCQSLVAWMGFTHPGGFQEYVTVPFEYLVPVPAHIGPATAPVLTCAMGTAYRAVAVRGAVRAGERVVVLGLGGVGIHAAQVAQVCGARTLGVDRTDAKLEPARRVGIDALARADELDERARELTDGEGADVVIETTGVPSMVEAARRVGRPGARIVAVGYTAGETVTTSSDQFVLWEYSLLGSRYATRADMERGARLVADGHVQPVIDEVLDLEQANTAIARLEAGEATGRLVLAVHPDALAADGQTTAAGS
jgi:2-desacetyl-2-hydroxyethyl bacteriochlorophyllide A dehydrogenase